MKANFFEPFVEFLVLEMVAKPSHLFAKSKVGCLLEMLAYLSCLCSTEVGRS